MIHVIYSFHIPKVDPSVYISMFLKIQVSLVLLHPEAEGTMLHQNFGNWPPADMAKSSRRLESSPTQLWEPWHLKLTLESNDRFS